MDYIKAVLGHNNPAPSASGGGFADFAAVPEPSPILASTNDPFQNVRSTAAVPYTQWYRVWERTELSDFYTEMVVLPFIILIAIIHFVGRRMNTKRAQDWAKHHIAPLEFEFASVGFGGGEGGRSGEEEELEKLRENSPSEYISYATGRQNVAFVDIKLTLLRRYNPIQILGEQLIGFVFESVPATVERMEATLYAFDGKEQALVPQFGDVPKPTNSTYDGFVWAIMHKRILKRMRDERYDVSLTATKDHPKLPVWTTVLSENAEVTNLMLTPQLISAVESAGDLFDALIVTDQPMDRPTK